MLLESRFQAQVIQDIKKLLPGALVLKTDPTYIQGFPDLLILYEDRWGALEVKRSPEARHGNNQEYYVALLDDMSYASFIHPANKEEVLRELQQALQLDW